MRLLTGWQYGVVCMLAAAAAWTASPGREAAVGRPGCGVCAASAMVGGLVQVQGESRPRLPRSFATSRFRLYYTDDPRSPHKPALEDDDADGVPDSIERLGGYFEAAWSVFMGEAPTGMGFAAPPVKGDGRYVVYVYQLPQGFSGQTWPESKSGRRASSHISIDGNLYEPYVRAVAAHELFHAVQFGYNYSASAWWKEASADWAAGEVFPDVDTYIIPYYDWFQVPGWSLHYTDGWHEYGSSIWAKQLAESRGREVIRAIWDYQRSENDTLKATARALEDRGTTLRQQFKEFVVWNWFTGERADTAHYRQGPLFPMLQHEGRAASNLYPLSGSLPALSSVYIALTPPGVRAPVSRGLTFRVPREGGIDAQLLLEPREGESTLIAITGTRYHVGDFERAARRAVLILSNGDTRSRSLLDGSVSLGLVYRDQYGYVWDLQVDGAGGVRGTVEVGDEQPWTVTGVMEAEAFRWRATNPRANPGERWSSGFEVAGTQGDRASAPASRWSSDTGRADDWIGTVLEGLVPPAVLTNRRGPALR